MSPKKVIQNLALSLAVFQIGFVSAEIQRVRPERIAAAEAINFLTNTIVFNGQKYQLTDETKWHGLESGEDPKKISNLKNRRMGYTVVFPKEGLPIITQIWVH